MPTYHINRSRALSEILQDRGWREAAPTEVADLAMWDTYRAELRVGRIQLFRREHAKALDNKIQLYRNLAAVGGSGLMPETYMSVEEIRRTGQRGGVWFLKPAHLSGGRQIACFTSLSKLASAAWRLGYPYVIQREVEDPLLLNGHKFTIRSFVVMFGDGRAYVHREALLVLQSAPYRKGSTAPSVQFLHRKASYRSSRDLRGFSNLQAHIRHVVAQTVRAVVHHINPAGEPGRYQFCGFDFVPTQAGRSVFIEANAWPNLGSTDPLQRAIKQRVLDDLATILADPEDPGAVEKGGFEVVPIRESTCSAGNRDVTTG